jgi:inner membrane protein
MASFGHVAVGLLAGRLHGGPPGPADRRASAGTLALFAAVSMLPDADVFIVAMGASDAGAMGHRAASHSLSVAVGMGLLGAVVAGRLGWPVMRTALAVALATASHALLDLLGIGGRGLMVLWPFSFDRLHSPWRLFPNAPRGIKLLSHAGLIELAIEIAIFSPLTLYALWPQIRERLDRVRITWGWRTPDLRLVEGAAAPGGPAAPARPPPVAPRGDPRLRSSG